MKRYPAIATVEFADISAGTYTTDAMIKKAPIAVVRSGIISRGRYLTLIGGSTASVEEAFNEGIFLGKDALLDQVFLPDVHPGLHDAVLSGKRVPCAGESVAVIETDTVSCNLLAAERALKGTPVQLVEIRPADPALHGKCTSVYHGALYDIQAAVDIAVSGLTDKNYPVTHRIVTAPHKGLSDAINAGTSFADTKTISLEGEAC